jgi:hypothetical protein
LKAIVPWHNLVKRQSSYFQDKYILEGYVLGDPSHLTTDQVQELLNHWYDLQGKHSRVLHFHQVLKSGELQASAKPTVQGQAKRSGKGKKKVQFDELSDESRVEDRTVRQPAKRSRKGKKKAQRLDQWDGTANNAVDIEANQLLVFSKTVYKTPLPQNRP